MQPPYWCPNGCGKKINYSYDMDRREHPYRCLECEKNFTKQQVYDYHNGIDTQDNINGRILK